MKNHPGTNKWYVLVLAALTGALAITAPSASLAVLFSEISNDLHLSLVQMGLLWSIGSLPAIFTSPLSGAVIDRFGPRRVMLFATISVGLVAGMRGLAADFASFFWIVILIGVLVPLITMSAFKISSILFPPRQLGLANGIFSMGMGFGFLLGSLLSATVISPWLGGWRNVMFFYGAIAALLCIPWYFTRSLPGPAGSGSAETEIGSMRASLTQIVKLKNVWLLGVTVMGINGCVQGLLGYLSLYLRGLGWTGASADGALSLLSIMSMIFVLPLALGSDRLFARKKILLAMILMIAVGTGLLSVGSVLLVWGAVIMIGMVRDGSMAVLMTMVIETDGVGPVYAGTASGFVMFFLFAGNLLAPPIGNRLAEISPGLAFIFWSGLAFLGVASLTFVKSSRAARLAPEAR
ncbi:MAG: MFS transporter [Chloroflexota bacterium]|nr:MAG: MFS transporter [Chloroflexota bacterium]